MASAAALRSNTAVLVESLESRLCLSAPLPWAAIDDFAYQLQDLSLPALARSKFDLAVIDYSRDGTDAQRLTRAQVRSLQQSRGGPKRILAYLSIGEAEDYRWYWKPAWDADRDGMPDASAPAWLGRQNPDWPGNYKVRYWDPQWQAVILHYVDKIIQAGFDGVYLDVVDAYEYWGPGGEGALDRASAGSDMVKFVRRISEHARQKSGRPDFGIFVQNGEALCASPSYLRAITGIGREDVWYTGNRANASAEVRQTTSALDRARRAKRLVLCIDYVTNRSLINRFYAAAAGRGFVAYATTRNLDRLVVNAGHEPD